MLTVQQAVFTVESFIGKVQPQKQLIAQQQQVIDQLFTENKQLRKENEQLKYRVQGLEARTKKNSSNSHLPPSSDRFHTHSSHKPSGNKLGGQGGAQRVFNNFFLIVQSDKTTRPITYIVIYGVWFFRVNIYALLSRLFC